VPLGLGVFFWQFAERPALLVSEPGGLVGRMTPEGRALSRPRGDGFVARIWLENDGDGADQARAATRPGWRDAAPGVAAALGDLSLWHGTGRAASRRVQEACARHDIVVVNLPPEDPDDALRRAEQETQRYLAGAEAGAEAERPVPCLLMTPRLLSRTGALSLSVEQDRLRIATARSGQGERLWSN
jgi:competence protein ComEC